MEAVSGFRSFDGQIFTDPVKCRAHELDAYVKELKMEFIETRPQLLNMLGGADIRIATVPDKEHMDMLLDYFDENEIIHVCDKKTFGKLIIVVTDINRVYIYEASEFFEERIHELGSWCRAYNKYKNNKEGQ